MAVLRRGRWLVWLAVLSLAPGKTGRAAEVTEYGVKAAYLANLFSYVQWPTGHADRYTVCVLGRDPFGQTLEQTFEQNTSRQIKIRRLGEGQAANECEIVFVAQDAPKRFAPVLARALQAGVLTVGEGSETKELGALVVLEMDQAQRRVRIAIDARAAANHGFRISSRLLSIARPFKGGK